MNRVYRDIGLFEWLAIALVVGLTLSWAVGKIPVGSAVAAGLSQGGGGELQQLRYNNPGLVVDLGVGLWAWPVPGDADGDGDYDLIVS